MMVSLSADLCKRMGGEKRGDTCFVGDFPIPSTISDWYGETVGPVAVSEGNGVVLHMSPEDAKKFFPPKGEYYEPSVEKIMERIKDGEPINPPWMSMCLHMDDSNHTLITGHEGRHRIEAARRLGLDKVPIILAEKSMSYCLEYEVVSHHWG